MNTKLSDVDLSKRLYDMTQAYVMYKTEAKSGIKWDFFKGKFKTDPDTGRTRLDVPPKYREAREKVCKDAFLKLRSCRSREDFIAYFTGTICSVPQFLPPDEYRKIATSLLDENKWEDANALVMLALSGLARI